MLGLIVCLFICLLVSHRCVSLLVRVWALDVLGELDLTHDMMIFFRKIPVWLVCYAHDFHVILWRVQYMISTFNITVIPFLY